MSTLIALLISLAVYTCTVAAINYKNAAEGSPLNFDIYQAFDTASSEYGLIIGIPEPIHMAVGGLVLVLPAIIVFAIIRFIVR
ncbi:MAG: hypothetical protein AAF228_13535 [Pseudomonadota bacterium]